MIYLIQIGQLYSSNILDQIGFERKEDAREHIISQGYFCPNPNFCADYFQHKNLRWAQIVPINFIKSGQLELFNEIEQRA